MKELIDWLEKRGFTWQADSLKNGGTSLYLGLNQIGDIGCKELAASLKTNTTLTSLDLSQNSIGKIGGKELAASLKTNTMLTSLDLSQNSIGKIGGKELAASLKTNTTLTSLHLSYNKIGDTGCKELAASLKTNTTLTSLKLWSNKIGEIGVKELAASLKTNTTLTSLNLHPNSIGDATVKEINKYLQRNKNLAKKAETLNTQGDSFCGKGEYDKAIEKYNKAIKISKKPLYVTNKTNAVKKYEEQQQATDKEFEQLILAIKENKAEEAEKLVKKIDAHILNKINTNGCTALILAASQSLEKVCELLIPKMSDQAINQVTNNGNTALTVAARYDLEKVCELLILKMTDQAINHVNKHGETALSLVQQKGFKNICDLLVMKANKQNKETSKENTEKKDKIEEIKNLANLNTNKLQEAQEIKTEKQEVEKKIYIVNESNKEHTDELIQKLILDITGKIGKNTAISERNKEVMQKQVNKISNLISTANLNKTNIEIVTNKIIEVAYGNKFTRGTLVDLEEEIKDVLEHQKGLSEAFKIFEQAITEIKSKLDTNLPLKPEAKAALQHQINSITDKVTGLISKDDIQKITNEIKELITTNKITKGRLIDLEDSVDQLIEQQNSIMDNNVKVNIVNEIIYDNPLLNHPELLQAAVNSKLSSNLIQEAINNNDEELILAGLISVGYDVGLIN